MLNCCLLTQAVLFMKYNQRMFMIIFFKYKHLFDFSNYPKDSKFFDPTNKKVIGYWQNERQV